MRPPEIINCTGFVGMERRANTQKRPQTGERVTPQLRRPLRVCMVAYGFYETDSRVVRYAEALVQQGDQVDVFALRKPANPRRQTLRGVRVHGLQQRLLNEKSRLSYVGRTILFLSRALYYVSTHDLRKRYDIVHIHSVPDFLVFSALIPWLRGTPVILDIRDILPEFYASKFGVSDTSIGFRFLCFVERICAKFANHVIVANHPWQQRLVSRSVSPGDCSVMLNVPDRSIFVRRMENNSTTDRFLLLYHGTLNWHQGLDLAIRAFAKIANLAPEVDFHIYGDGPSKPDLLTLIKELHLESRVLLHEPRPLREIASVIETAKLGIVPKRKDNFGNEAFSTKTLEFMAMGVPVIVSDTKVDRYYLNESVVQFFRGDDEDDLARCMVDLVLHPEKRAAMAKRALQFAAVRDWAVQKEEYLALLDGLISSTACRMHAPQTETRCL